MHFIDEKKVINDDLPFSSSITALRWLRSD